MKIELPQDFRVWNKDERILENTYTDGTFPYAFASVVIKCLCELEKEDVSLDKIFSKSRTDRDVISIKGYLIVMFHQSLESMRPKMAKISRSVCGIFGTHRTVYNHYKDKFDHGLLETIDKSRFGRSVKAYLMEFSNTDSFKLVETRTFTLKDIETLTDGCASCLNRFKERFHKSTTVRGSKE